MPRPRLPAGWVGSRPRCRRQPTITVRRRTYPVNGLIGLTPRWRPNGSHRTWTGSVGPRHGAQTRGAQEGTAWNGHFGCMCYHPLFVFTDIHGMTAIVEPILSPRADICNPGPSPWGSRDIENGDAGAGCGRSSAISRRISANRPPWHRALGQPGQLDWNVTYRPCVTIPATILIGVSFRPVGDHRLTASGRPGVRMKLPGLQASA